MGLGDCDVLQVVKELLESGANIHYRSSTSSSDSLTQAIEKGHAVVVYLLLKHGAVPPNWQRKNKARALLVEEVGVLPYEADVLVGLSNHPPAPLPPLLLPHDYMVVMNTTPLYDNSTIIPTTLPPPLIQPPMCSSNC